MLSLWDKFVAAGGFAKGENLPLFLDMVDPGDAFDILGAIILFVILFAMCAQSGVVAGPWPRAVWMWQDDDTKNPSLPPGPQSSWNHNFMVKQACEAPGSYLGWAKKVGVNETWLDAFFLLDAGLDQKLVSFLKQAKSQGMGVQFLVSDMKQFNTLLTFCGTQLLKAGVFPDAFQTDYEPGNKEDATSQFQDHVTMKSRLADFEEEFGTKIRLTVSVQYWYIDYGPADTVGNKIPTTDYPVSKATVAADGKSTVPCPPKPYGDALLELGLDLTLQDYGNPNWDATPLSLAKLWCDRALDHKCQVYVGLDVGPPTSAYAFEQDIAGMEALLESIYTSLFSHSGFAGMAVHNTLWYGAFT